MDPAVSKIAGMNPGSRTNASRNLHRYIHKNGKTLPVPITTIPVRVREVSRGGAEAVVQHPVIGLADWMQYILTIGGGQFLLGGHATTDSGYQDMFALFWKRFRVSDPEHPVYHQKTEAERCLTIPMSFHGDEGRGLAKVPLLVESYQPVISWLGPNVVNSLGHLYSICVRNVYVCVCPYPSLPN